MSSNADFVSAQRRLLNLHENGHNMNYIQIANYVYKKYTKTDKFPKNKCKFLWSLLTINERKNFIKNYT